MWSVRKIRGVTSGTFGSTMLRCGCEADTVIPEVEVESVAHRPPDLHARGQTCIAQWWYNHIITLCNDYNLRSMDVTYHNIPLRQIDNDDVRLKTVTVGEGGCIFSFENV